MKAHAKGRGAPAARGVNRADDVTRDRLLKAAERLFADRGFRKVTVREVCRAAHANVAAVNYHFGDKAGLYRAVVTFAMDVMRETNELSQRAGDGLSPEEQLRSFVRVFVTRLTGDGPNTWIHRLMAREMEQPTEALDLVMTHIVKPRLEYLSGVAGQLMGMPPDDPRVKRCIASLQMQCLMAARGKVPPALEKSFGPAMRDIDGAVEHIVEFTLGGLRAIAGQ